jgi:hypothetical protein
MQAADPVALIMQLDLDAISLRLDAIRAEREALLVLLRTARAWQRHGRPRPGDVALPGAAPAGTAGAGPTE